MKVFATRVPISNIVGVDVGWLRFSQALNSGFSCVLLSSANPELPFKDESFDIVFSSNVIEHIPRDLYRGYLREIHRVLKRGGRFAVGAPNYPIKRIYDLVRALHNPQYRWYYLFDDPTHCNKQSIFAVERDLKSLFETVNLEPSYLFFQKDVSLLRKKKVRYILRGFGYKFFGYCLKAL